ncbi:efflux RND transporter periplasmic adaptor subunit [Gemmatimonas sp.]|jgi:cobalt-zinc-cadmium efflux system membrane fusion protein|uniref:efflux RND transporter periplasmic adaptor subunit n=1 Tax=Gemmatimonas sp. TaxID=1962908 RepID=UPI003918E5E2
MIAPRIVAACLLVTPLFLACSGTGDTPAATPAPTSSVDTATLSADAVKIAGVTLDTARILPWQAMVTVPGRLALDPSSLETIGSITEGRITHVTVRVGDRVAPGQALVMIHSHEIMDARSALAAGTALVTAMEAERDLAATASERATRLFDNKAMSKADVERAEVGRRVALSNYERAVADRDRARALVEHLAGLGPLPAGADQHDVVIRTPIGGVVTSREAQPGTVVLPGTPLVTVGNPSKLQIEMHVPEQQALGITAGARVAYQLTEAPGETFAARVVRVAPTVDTLTRTVQVIAQLEGRTTGRAETFVQAAITGRGETPALLVAARAVQALDGDTVVFVAEARGEGMHIRATPVRVGRRTTDRVELLAGVTEGMTVVVRGAAIAKAELLKRRDGGGE